MIKSMTGYGKAQTLLENGNLTIEFRSVNGKSADINIKSSLLPKDKEIGIRKRIADKLQRGSIDMFINYEPNAGEDALNVNMDIALNYYSQMKEFASKLDGELSDTMEQKIKEAAVSSLLKMPGVIDSAKKDIISDDNWEQVSQTIDKALDAIDAYRCDEGVSLYKDVTSRVKNILDLYDEVESYEEQRISATRERILKAAEDLKIKLDPERFEQEMIFYLEKLDINEEKVRLRQHCKYFMETIDGEECPGKKLGFIIQEMGREINTTGSKANHASIQKCVVRMKDELEKIREQSMNIL